MAILQFPQIPPSSPRSSPGLALTPSPKGIILSAMRFHLLTLGCPKNVTDSEGMTNLLVQAGHAAVTDPRHADVLIVNTCGFIDIARAESLDALLAAGKHKRRGQVLIAAGCLAERAAADLQRQIPSVDAVLGTRHWQEIPNVVRELAAQRELRDGNRKSKIQNLSRANAKDPKSKIQNPRPSAYLKISDGCNSSCAFCIIPQIKGPYQSKPVKDILAEARDLTAQGVQEIVLVAQDTALYGSDLGQRDGLAVLLERILEAAPSLPWLRLMYCYPQHVTPRLICVMADSPQVCQYLDLPLQHAHPATLQRMGRPSNVDQARDLIARLRAAMPQIALRSSFIVGYPGETEEEFAALLDFLREARLDRAGFFTYSPEEGTPAAALPGQVPPRIKKARYRQAMQVQQKVSREKNQEWVERTLDVLIEGVQPGLSIGRSFRDAPEVDGLVLVQGQAELGSIVPVRITAASEYDLWGELESTRTDRLRT